MLRRERVVKRARVLGAWAPISANVLPNTQPRSRVLRKGRLANSGRGVSARKRACKPEPSSASKFGRSQSARACSTGAAARRRFVSTRTHTHLMYTHHSDSPITANTLTLELGQQSAEGVEVTFLNRLTTHTRKGTSELRSVIVCCDIVRGLFCRILTYACGSANHLCVVALVEHSS